MLRNPRSVAACEAVTAALAGAQHHGRGPSGARRRRLRRHNIRAQRPRRAAAFPLLLVSHVLLAYRPRLHAHARRAHSSAWAAFLRTAKLSREALFGDSTLVNALARNHVVPHVALRLIDFTPGEALATLRQESLRVGLTAGVYVITAARSTAAITVADIASQRCIMHIVDTMLVPSSIRVDV